MFNNIGYSYQLKGELELALENYQNNLKILEEIDYKLAISAALNNIGLTYHLKGELDLALEHLKRSLAVAKVIDYKPLIGIDLGSIGIIHFEKGGVDYALESYEKSLYIHEELGNNLYTSDILFRLVALTIENKAVEAARAYMQKLETLKGKEENKIVNQRYLLSEALLLKSSDRLVEKASPGDLQASSRGTGCFTGSHDVRITQPLRAATGRTEDSWKREGPNRAESNIPKATRHR